MASKTDVTARRGDKVKARVKHKGVCGHEVYAVRVFHVMGWQCDTCGTRVKKARRR